MPNLQSELATRVFFVTQKEIWKINVQKDGERKSFYSKLPGKRGQKDCAAKAAAWLLSDLPLSLSDKTTVDDLFELYLKDKALETTDTYNIANRYKNHIAPVIGRMHSWSSDATMSKMLLSSVPAPMFNSLRVVSPRCHALPMVTCAYALGVLCIVMMGSSSSLSKYLAFNARKIFSKYPAVLDVFTVSFIFVSSLSIFSISTHVIPSG